MLPRSDRDIPLILCHGELPDSPVLTVECYVKWYSIFLVKPNGTVEKVNIHDHVLSGDMTGTIEGDHVFNPVACEILAEKLGVEWDEIAFETIVGRWVIEYLDADTTEEIKLAVAK